MADKPQSARPGILDIDIGNTRIKWRLDQGQDKELLSAWTYTSSIQLPPDWRSISPGALTRIRIASVASKELNDKVVKWSQEHWGIAPEFAVARAYCRGVKNAYMPGNTLGVDRWLAILAAYQHCQKACVVVDCGSAVTVDLLTGEGVHLGGYIVPGLHLMRSALADGTAEVDTAVQASELLLAPGCNTREAVNHGLLLAIKGLLTEAFVQLARREQQPDIVLSGGDGLLIQQCLQAYSERYTLHYIESLVVDGLAWALP